VPQPALRHSRWASTIGNGETLKLNLVFSPADRAIRTGGFMTDDTRPVDDEAVETREWLESLEWVLRSKGPGRVRQLLEELDIYAQQSGVRIPFSANTPHINTIPASDEPPYPGSREIERRIKSIVRWNAMAMVVRANMIESGIGGHISTYASAATLYEVAFNHFLHGKSEHYDGDQVYFQGHAAPGIYARAFLEGRLTEEQLKNFRREVSFGRGNGLSSYPHPMAHARLLGIPDRLHGTRSPDGDLPGPLQPLPGGSRAPSPVEPQGVGLSRRR
jgi:pyruvate dehydrogenase complex dehydrogenase (E1) component